MSTAYLKFGTNADYGCANAFKHAFWMHLVSRDAGASFAKKKLGDAHECNQSRNDSQMDLLNNDIGRSVAFSHPYAISEEVCRLLENGSLFVLSNINDPNSSIVSSFGCLCH